MLKVIVGGYICSIFILYASSIRNGDNYDESYEDEVDNGNSTEEYDSLGRELISELRPVYPLNNYFGSGPQTNFQELFNYQRPHKRPGLKKRRILRKKGYKYIIPLLLGVLTKVANFLPVAKLTLLALFTLVLFSKKALLVSIGSLILVIYDSFHNRKNKGTNTVKVRASTVPSVDQGSLSETNLEGWWGREESRPTRLDFQADDNNKSKRRWWVPQINFRTKPDSRSPSDSKLTDELVIHNLLHS